MLNYLPAAQSLFTPAVADTTTLLLKFLGDELSLRNPNDWNCNKKTKLFLYNVHYFDDLNSTGAIKRKQHHDALIHRWIIENPPTCGNGWEPYPLSLRIVNWIKFFSRQDSVPTIWLDSLATQTAYLSNRLEYHLLGNHLFTNAKALIFAGCYLENADAHLKTGLAILNRELPEQVLNDGGHFELSPMYHCIAMADLLDLINIGNSYPNHIPASVRQNWQNTVKRMFLWLNRMRHPDGQISLFNDSAFGIAPEFDQLSNYARTLGITPPTATIGVHHAAASGYVSIQRDDLCCFLDVGHIGPDYIPGHAHADSLTFELSLFGQRLICDSGISEYGSSPERLRQRGTSAHNTVLIDQCNSSEVWSGFRVARRAYPINVRVAVSKNHDYESTFNEAAVTASHTGYRRLKGKNIHTRKWLIKGNRMIISDKISGPFTEAIALFHLHPSVIANQRENDTELHLPSGQRAWISANGKPMQIQPSTWHPRFGESHPSQRLSTHFDGSVLETQLHWEQT